MPLEATVHTDALGNLTVQMVGSLDFENNIPLRKQLETLLEKNPLSNITLDLHFLDFVGSSGIGHFVELINNMNLPQVRIFLCNVKPEFIKVFKLFSILEMEQVIRDFEGQGEQQTYAPKRNFKNSFEKG